MGNRFKRNFGGGETNAIRVGRGKIKISNCAARYYCNRCVYVCVCVVYVCVCERERAGVPRVAFHFSFAAIGPIFMKLGTHVIPYDANTSLYSSFQY